MTFFSSDISEIFLVRVQQKEADDGIRKRELFFLISLKEALAWRDMWPEIARWKALFVLVKTEASQDILYCIQ